MQRGAEIPGVVPPVGIAPGGRRQTREEFSRSGNGAEPEYPNAIGVHGGVGQCRYTESVGEVESIGRADRTGGGAIVFAAHECEGGHGSQTSQYGAAGGAGGE